MVLDASVVLIGPEGERTMPLVDFYELDGMKKNVLKTGEFLLKVVLPEEAAQRKVAIKNSGFGIRGISQRLVWPHHGCQATARAC